VSYFRAIDPFPLESAEHNRLHEFYARLGAGTLSTTRCGGCGRTAWPPRVYCPECGSDAFTWTELSGEGVVHGFTVQETGLPVGFLVAADPARLRIGQRVRLTPLRVTDDAKGQPRWLPAFTPDS